MNKAEKFQKAAEQNGWAVQITEKGDEAHVRCTRGGESLYIWWRENSLIETPKYTINGATISTHNAAGAFRQLEKKPDYNKAFRRTRRAEVMTEEKAEIDPLTRMQLPFDIDDDPDSVILREIRGSRLTWLNGKTGVAESAHVPYKVMRGSDVRLMNTDLTHVFYLAAGNDDRAYVSFMDPEGRFRAVYLDAILSVA